ncbi:hypothetical protein DEU56DRAFT_915343 [Suillus clintonianus]|uniref:uncharacterized protein n=1 Tax=Suillus clintonianus TaxID=1904413 RepID=UPI001B869114|nr:uncharacterized protein DEU56DRAFT_915343 [Suillus clintonianus]KAG2129028.1 hypothetical protein DEU56DRAFT_915343 [Suillus clintonianus]
MPAQLIDNPKPHHQLTIWFGNIDGTTKDGQLWASKEGRGGECCGSGDQTFDPGFQGKESKPSHERGAAGETDVPNIPAPASQSPVMHDPELTWSGIHVHAHPAYSVNSRPPGRLTDMQPATDSLDCPSFLSIHVHPSPLVRHFSPFITLIKQQTVLHVHSHT